MKTKVLTTLTICFCFVISIYATEADEKKNNTTASVMNLLKVTGENLNINCLAYDEFAARIGTTEEKLNDYMHEIFQNALQETALKVKNGTKYFLKLDQYELSAAGYPYNNFQHTINYSIYNENMEKVYQGNHRFATFSDVSKEDLAKQFKKVSKKALSVINKK